MKIPIFGDRAPEITITLEKIEEYFKSCKLFVALLKSPDYMANV